MLWVVAATVLFGGGAIQPASAAVHPTAPPSRFFGVFPQAPLTANDFARMRGVVGTLRLPIFWFECEPTPGVYDFATLDAEIAAAAAGGIRVQPVVFGTPPWLSPEQARPPLSPHASTAWSSFLHVLVKRYGTGGKFWMSRVHREPIRLWQVWNEPNFVLFWRPWPRPAAYARLLRFSARAIRSADPRARIALAGVAPVNAGITTWVYLRRLLQIPGVRRDFDVAAVHPYSATVPELEYQIRRVRRAMAQAGLSHRSLLVSEVGVASTGDYPSAFVKGLFGQSQFLSAAYARLLDMRLRWRISGVDWYAWQDAPKPDPYCSFCQGAGLMDLSGRPKPAWWAFRRVVKGAGSQRSR
jgi:hypothetical protein